MSKDMKILFIVFLAGFGVVCFAETEATVSASQDEDQFAYAAPPPDPLEESLNVVTGIAEGSFNVVAEAAEGTAKAIVELAGGAATTFERDILTMPGRFLGKDVVSATGLTVGVTSVNIYQQNMRGGTSTKNKRGRFNGLYTLEVGADFERLFGLEGIGFYAAAEGYWSRTGDIDGASVGSAFGVNGQAGARRSLDVLEAWFEGSLFDGAVRLRAGKLDIAGGFESGGSPVAFDVGTYAGDTASQFLNTGLESNAGIPFPDEGIGAVLFYNPVDWWYGAVGVVDAQTDNRETGLRTAFYDEDYFFYVFETGLTPQLNSKKGPLAGAYRVGLWVDGQDKARFTNGKNYRDDTGVYVSCDQMIRKENDDPEDSQGVGAFFRWGYANSDLNEIGNFWSFGFQYQGLVDGCDDDVLGLGMARGIFSDHSGANDGAGYTEHAETAYEVYYNAAINDSWTLSPTLQYIADPGGTKGASDAVVFGIRAVVAF